MNNVVYGGAAGSGFGRPRRGAIRRALLLIGWLSVPAGLPLATAAALIFACSPNNDLFRVATANGLGAQRFDNPDAAVAAAMPESGVLVLADGYPAATTVLDAGLFDKAARKRLRLYVEYPSLLPGLAVGAPRGTQWERAAIASDVFLPGLAKLRILAIHDCHFVPIKAERPHIVIGRVAGFDTAVYGLARESFPLLCELPRGDGGGEVLVATTKLSHFLTGRSAPADAWHSVWDYVFTWLEPHRELKRLSWEPTVRPSYGAGEVLPANVEQQALRRGIDWYFNSRMVLHPSAMARYDRPANGPEPAAANPDLRQDWPYGHRVARMPDLKPPPGDGSLGVLEGFDAKIFPDGTQPVRWWLRNDCNGEIAGTMALAGIALSNPVWLKTAGNIGDWLYFRSRMSLDDHANPQHPAYGLFGWNETPQYCGPGSMDGFAVYYGDDNARSMLGMMLAGAALKTDRYDERLLQCLLANLRISGPYGFQPDRLDQGPLEAAGWQHYFNARTVTCSPHYQATVWACDLWAHRQTGFDLFLERARTAIRRTMEAYPERWVWSNGIQQERAKMLLALAWLVRVDDTPEHRAWLRRMAGELLAGQDACGAIREQIGLAGKGGCPPPASNEAYGTAEAPLIQSNADAASDLLYTCNFAVLALHEAAAATGDAVYRQAEDRLTQFLCRVQIRSEDHPELDGGWFRAFDFKRWEYWASSTDAGWGAWCIESGWTQSWITGVLAMRQMRTSLWELTARSQVARHFARLRPEMIPDSALELASTAKLRHDALEKKAVLITRVSEAYPGDGAASLTDGILGSTDCKDGAWLGFHGTDLAARIDLGQPTALKDLGASFLHNAAWGIYLPTTVEFLAGDSPAALRSVGTATTLSPGSQAGPFKERLRVRGLNLRARYIEVRAANIGVIPAGYPAAGEQAWLFVDEVIVNGDGGR
jgi:hypothetical protein